MPLSVRLDQAHRRRWPRSPRRSALPPRSSICTPARAASGWLAATMPNCRRDLRAADGDERSRAVGGALPPGRTAVTVRTPATPIETSAERMLMSRSPRRNTTRETASIGRRCGICACQLSRRGRALVRVPRTGGRADAGDVALLLERSARSDAGRDRSSGLLLPFPRCHDRPARVALRAVDDRYDHPDRRRVDRCRLLRSGNRRRA